MSPDTAVSPGNILLFLGAVFGAIAAYARPVRDPHGPCARRPWERWDLPLSSFLLLLFFILLVIRLAPAAGGALAELVRPGATEDRRLHSIAATFLMQAGLVAVVLDAIRRRGWSVAGFFRPHGTSWAAAARHSGHLFLRHLPLVWLVGLFWGGLLLGLRELGVGIEPRPQQAVLWIAESQSLLFVAAMGLMVVLGAPFSEELLFRAFLYRFLAERWSARFALIVSGVLFALLHASLLSFLPLCFLGLLLAKIYEDTRDIRTPVLFHLYFNLFSFVNLLLLPEAPVPDR
ncbi:MAG: CPBP family intramembrane glutamic endopeptidase [Puniceicoccaceae bacterium]